MNAEERKAYVEQGPATVIISRDDMLEILNRRTYDEGVRDAAARAEYVLSPSDGAIYAGNAVMSQHALRVREKVLELLQEDEVSPVESRLRERSKLIGMRAALDELQDEVTRLRQHFFYLR